MKIMWYFSVSQICVDICKSDISLSFLINNVLYVKYSFSLIRRVRTIAKIDLASSCLYVRPSVYPMEQLGSHWRDFHEV